MKRHFLSLIFFLFLIFFVFGNQGVQAQTINCAPTTGNQYVGGSCQPYTFGPSSITCPPSGKPRATTPACYTGLPFVEACNSSGGDAGYTYPAGFDAACIGTCLGSDGVSQYNIGDIESCSSPNMCASGSQVCQSDLTFSACSYNSYASAGSAGTCSSGNVCDGSGNCVAGSTGPCGSAAGVPTNTFPSSNLCGSGYGVVGNWTDGTIPAFEWMCSPGSGYTTCSAPDTAPIAGQCGSDANLTAPQAPGTNLCSLGSPTSPIENADTTYSWSCNGVNAGPAASCSTNPATSLPDLTASAPSPATATINVAQSFTSTISNIGSASTGSSFSNFFQVASSANGAGTLTDLTATTMSTLNTSASNTATSPSYTFSSTGTYSVRACADKSSSPDTGTISESNEANNCSGWTNVVVTNSATMSGTLTPAAPSCTIPSGGSSCTINFSWTTTNPVATSLISSDTNNSGASFPNFSVVTGNNGGPTPFTIPFPSRNFYLYNNAVLLAQRSSGSGPINATCASGTSWDGTKCAPAGTQYLLTITPTVGGLVSSQDGNISCGSTCSYNYAQNVLVVLTATKSANFKFVGWSGDCVGTGTCTVTMTSAKNVSARFAPVPPTLQEF